MTSIENCIAIFLLCLVCVSLTESSCFYDVPSCYCYTMSISCSNLDALPPLQTGDDVNDVQEVTFESGNISDIPDTALPVGLAMLEFINNPLTNISDGAFDASADTLNTLSVYSAQFKRLPAALLKLSQLTSLKISDTFLDVWDDAILQHLAALLTGFNLTNVGLTQWPTWLSSFHSLTSLDLNLNALTPIPDDAFSSSKDTLVQLSLISAGLTHIPNALLNLQKLTVLDLSGNRLTEVSGRPGIEQLSSLPLAQTLVSISADFSGLSVIPDFSNLTNLVEISLRFNQISDLATDSIPLSVFTLDLQGNRITSVPANIVKLTRLYLLNLSVNEITDINLDIFPSRLGILHLEFNKITDIADSISANISSIEILYLSDNPISTISPLAFKNLVSLEYLHLDNTNLTSIPIAVAPLDQLYSLSMRNILPLNCPCPPSTNLVLWYQSLSFFFTFAGRCDNGQYIRDYLSDSCQTSPPAK